tara:strand:+ start:252 stop:623 length:372 start_codon:yes stop_codon:yes gene_type:complete
MNKDYIAYKTIGEVTKIINSGSKDGQFILAHTIRFWEKKFKQIRPKVLKGNRRYYDIKSIELLKKVHFLLKEQGMTIKGAKKILDNKEPLKLDEISNQSIKANDLKKKLTRISNIIKNLKNNK